MGMPQLIVTAVLVEGRSKSEVARDYGVSRRWVIILVQRFLLEGEAGLLPRSRRPLSSPRRTASAVEDEIIKIRKDLDKNGHEAGAATIAAHLTRRHGHAPAVSTIWRILTARGFVAPQPHKRPKASYLHRTPYIPPARSVPTLSTHSSAEATSPAPTVRKPPTAPLTASLTPKATP